MQNFNTHKYCSKCKSFHEVLSDTSESRARRRAAQLVRRSTYGAPSDAELGTDELWVDMRRVRELIAEHEEGMIEQAQRNGK